MGSELTPTSALAAPRKWKSPRPRRTVVLRGELFSDTGYSNATRALAAALGEHCDLLFGVSIYEDARRRQNAFSNAVITEEEVVHCANEGGEVVVVNVCLPQHFLHVPKAVNVGYFFWETDKFPTTAFWLARLKLMDRVWAPSSWQASFMREILDRDEIPVIPWPQSASLAPVTSTQDQLMQLRAHREMTLEQLRNYQLRASPPGVRDAEKLAEQRGFENGVDHRFDPERSPKLTDVLTARGDNFLAIQTDAPRKGLPLLLTSWLLFKQRKEGRHAKLVIKLSSIDVGADLYRIHFHASLALLRAKARFGVVDAAVSFVYDRLDNEQLEALLVSADALISATYGEGFGGPIAQALTHGIPVIAPDHTSLHDLLGDNYPLAVRSTAYPISLWQNISVYSPSSAWHLPDENHFVERLTQFSAMPPAARKVMGAKRRDDLLRRTGIEATRRLVAEELDKISQLWFDAASSEAATPAPSSLRRSR